MCAAPLTQTFANGYYIGELLSVWNLQPDFEKFSKSDEPSSAVSNFKRLQVRQIRQLSSQAAEFIGGRLMLWQVSPVLTRWC